MRNSEEEEEEEKEEKLDEGIEIREWREYFVIARRCGE